MMHDYQQFTATTAVYPEAGMGTKMATAYVALGLAGEAGEVAEKIKKWIRDGNINPEDIKKEMGDVCWYLAQLSTELGFRFEDVLNTNMKKLIDRKERAVLQGSGDNR